MPYTVREFEPTPNPNAVKCVLDAVISAEPRSYRKAADAAADSLASALFAIEGVVNVLICADFITIGREPGAKWPPIKREVQRVLSAAP